MSKMKEKKTPKEFEARSLDELYNISSDIFIQLVGMERMRRIELDVIVCILGHLVEDCGDLLD